MKELKANLVYLMYDHRYSITVFWSVLVASTALLFAVSYFISAAYMGLSLSLAIYIFCGITGFVLTKETFPYLIKLGSTRNVFLLSSILFNVSLAVFMSTVAVGVDQIVKVVVKVTNVANFQVFNMLEGTTLASTWYNEILLNIVICFLVLSFGFMLGAVFYRLGLVGGFSGIILLVFIVIFPETRNVLIDIFININDSKLEIPFSSLILLSILPVLPIWLLLRKASTIANVTR
jgi:ABC-2 type transport system permease protein